MANKYIQHFKSLALYRLFQEEPKLAKLLDHPSFNKEITEAMAINSQVRKFIYKYGKDVTLIDVGSGKGFLTLLLASLYPSTEVIAIDNNILLNKEQYTYFDNVTFIRASIFHDEMEEILKTHDKVVMAGSHLCKDLAVRFIELYNNNYNIMASVLMPCCIGHIPRAVRYKYTLINKELGNNRGNYITWCMYLASLYKEPVRYKVDREVLSPRNVLLISWRRCI